jgi:hypothetical protein
MGARMSWSDLLTDRLTGIVEGTYPAAPEAGRTIAADRFKPTLLHGQIEDPAFPAAHYHQGYRLALGQAVPIEPFNARAGIAKVRQRFTISVGYLFGRTAPRRAAGVGTATRSAEDVGAEDLWALVNALCYPAHWGTLNASPLLGLYGVAWVSSDVRTLQDRARLVRESVFEASVSLVPGGVYP